MKTILKIIKAFLKFLFSDNVKENTEYVKEYCKKSLMTSNELIFYKKLIEIEKIKDYKVIPQINLACIIQKKSNSRYQTELFRNIDFAIFNKELTDVLLLIELNDKTHNNRNRIKRDIKVKEICNQANIKLITFHTKYDNKQDYIINRILKEIREEKDEL